MNLSSMKEKINKVFLGDCLDLLKSLPDNSIDAVVTDPPYGIKFMGKKWDHEVPSVQVWEEVLRVLKPGGHILVACGTRTQHRMAVNIEDGGFEIRDVIAWHYGSGFPKSMDVSAAIDKRNGRFFDDGFKDYCNFCRAKKGYTLAQVNELMGTALTGGGFASSVMGEKEENELPTLEMYRKLKTILDMDDRYGSLIELVEAKREIIGQKASGLSEGSGHTVGRFTDSRNENGMVDITAPATTEATQWAGWGTALKPATEFWTLARKPFAGTVAQNVLQYGVGALNIDGSRIPFQNEEDFKSATFGTGTNIIGGNYAGGNHTLDQSRKNIEANPTGRWPANVILDEFMAVELDRQTGELTSGKPAGIHGSDAERNAYGKFKGGIPVTGYGDSGGASRFFYVAKPTAAERGKGNKHPTVKPIALIQYLIKMICPIEAGRIVLDLFFGSGTTGLAAKALGIDFIGAENDPESHIYIDNRFRENFGLFYGT